MIVEFIGAPGAGKTTLMPLVRDHFHALGLRAYPALEAARPFAARTPPGQLAARLPVHRLRRFLLWQIFYAFSRAHQREFRRQHPDLIRMVMEFQARRPIAGSDLHHVLHWFVHHTGVHSFLGTRAQPGEVLIYDEGFAHRVVQLFASEDEPLETAPVAAYLDLIPRPDLVIYARASREICEQRVRGRGIWPRFSRKEPAATSRFIRNAHQVVDFAVGNMRAAGWQMIEVVNEAQELPVVQSNLARGLREEMTKLAEGAF
jgi:thymidylate kinase